MRPKTKQVCDKIRTKLKSRITGEPEFKNNDDIVEAAVNQFYNSLRQAKYL